MKYSDTDLRPIAQEVPMISIYKNEFEKCSCIIQLAADNELKDWRVSIRVCNDMHKWLHSTIFYWMQLHIHALDICSWHTGPHK